MTRRALALSLVAFTSLAGLGCAAGGATRHLPLSAVPAEPMEEEFVPTGELQTRVGSSAFNAWRVVGPRINMTRRPDGSWAGTLVGRSYILKPGDGRLSAPGADLHFVRWGEEIVVMGNLGDLRIRLRFHPGPGLPAQGGKVCRFSGNLVDCRRDETRQSAGIRLTGEAAALDEPVMPQLGLALISIVYLSPVDR